MTVVAKHDCKLERESDDAEYGRVYLTVLRNSVGVRDLLENSRELVCFEISGRIN